MLVHDLNKRILGFVAHKRVEFITTRRICPREYIFSLFKKHPVKNKNDMNAFMSIDPVVLDGICKLNHITHIKGYNPFNVPMNLIDDYMFRDVPLHACTPPVSKSPKLFVKSTPNQNILDDFKNNNDVLALVSKDEYNSLKRNWKFHDVTCIPAGSIQCMESDHWYDKMPQSFMNPSDMYIISRQHLGKQHSVAIEDCIDLGISEAATKKTKTSKTNRTVKASKAFKKKHSRDSKRVDLNDASSDSSDLTFSTVSDDVVVYTDASIIDRQIGIGIWSEDTRFELQKYMYVEGVYGHDIDINRGELLAILYALMHLKSFTNHYTPLNVTIMTDSITAIKLLKGSVYCTKFETIVTSILDLIRSWNGRITIKKVKGHSGDIGNDNADFLARYGVVNRKSGESFLVPPEHNDEGDFWNYLRYLNS